ncbi:unnamed protein product, partial [Amoebophrya sp. A120]
KLYTDALGGVDTGESHTVAVLKQGAAQVVFHKLEDDLATAEAAAAKIKEREMMKRLQDQG